MKRARSVSTTAGGTLSAVNHVRRDGNVIEGISVVVCANVHLFDICMFFWCIHNLIFDDKKLFNKLKL